MEEQFIIAGDKLTRVKQVSEMLDLMYELSDGKQQVQLGTSSFTGAMILLSEILDEAYRSATYISPQN